ncbi:hypothetical protein IEO21_04290 [Rhodonia placenta]|uniref:Uncharacterized protein n=1 Tax=Rhodonia placenta TaxID=104341 RepID=A0A8H7P462_9APHY|nr:hypothetical protein IEO21_04290 [Postia placenta]
MLGQCASERASLRLRLAAASHHSHMRAYADAEARPPGRRTIRVGAHQGRRSALSKRLDESSRSIGSSALWSEEPIRRLAITDGNTVRWSPLVGGIVAALSEDG